MELAMLCLKVFLCRVFDVSCATMRTVLTVRGKSLLAAICGFVEVGVWFLVVREALNSGQNGLLLAISYASGFAIGTYIGGKIAHKLIRGNFEVQIITDRNDELLQMIRNAGFAISVVNVNPSEYGEGKYMIFAEIQNRRLNELKKIIYSIDPKAFIVARETRYVYNGFFQRASRC